MEAIVMCTEIKTEVSNYLDDPAEMFCEFCYKDGNQRQPAEGFCVECVTYFCTTCLKYHEKFHPNHCQQGKDNMPQDYYIQICIHHPDELVKFFCSTCNNTACSICKLISHKYCTDIHHLPELAKNFDIIKELLDIKDALVEAEKQVSDIKLMVDKGKEKVRKNTTEVKESMNHDRREIDKTFDNLERQVDEAEEKDNDELEKMIDKINTTTTRISTLRSVIENTVSESQKSKVFVAIKSAKSESQLILGNLHDIKTSLEEKEISKFRYSPFETLPNTTKNGRLAATREKEKNDRILFWSLVVLMFSFAVDIYQFENQIKSRELSLTFEPLTLSYISTNTLLTGAFDPKSIYTVDKIYGKYGEFHSSKSANSYINSARAKDEIAVMFKDGDILFYTINLQAISWNRRNKKHIRVHQNGQHFVYNNGTFFILYAGEESNIKIYDTAGNLLKNIAIRDKFQILSPWNIAVSPENNIIYITDSDLVVMLTVDGNIKGYFRHTNLIRPTGMATDRYGNLYVCGYLSNNVFKISPDFSQGNELLGRSHGINRPFSISYNEDENELAVGCFGRKSIQIFKLNQTWFQNIKQFFTSCKTWFSILKMFFL